MEILSDFTDAIENVRKGNIIIRKGFLQSLGLLDAIRNATFDKCPKLRNNGFENMHKVLSGKEILDLNVNVVPVIQDIGRKITHTFVREHIGYDKEFYIDNAPVVRFFTPHDFFKENESILGDRQGYLRIQGPHHDTWFGHATEGLNLWMAIGRVRKGNGLSLYPETWGKQISHKNFRIPKDVYLGPAVNFELDPGDLLFFHGEFMHASELNITDETRYVITTRFSVKEPIFKEGGNSPWIHCK